MKVKIVTPFSLAKKIPAERIILICINKISPKQTFCFLSLHIRNFVFFNFNSCFCSFNLQLIACPVHFSICAWPNHNLSRCEARQPNPIARSTPTTATSNKQKRRQADGQFTFLSFSLIFTCYFHVSIHPSFLIAT